MMPSHRFAVAAVDSATWTDGEGDDNRMLLLCTPVIERWKYVSVLITTLSSLVVV